MAKRIKWEEHPSITTVNGKPKLKVFEEYFVEEDLPKFKKLQKEDLPNDSKVAAGMENMDVEAATGIVPAWHAGEGVELRESDREAARSAKWTRNRYVALRMNLRGSGETKERGFMHGVKACAAWVAGIAKKATAPEPMSVEDVFMLAKSEEIEVTTEDLLRSRAIAAALVRRFEQTCQYGMARKVRDHLDVLSAKLALARRGMCRYITEDQAIEFMTGAERGVQVEFLRYYPEIIPTDVAAKIAECNLALLFDNYVVMYYSTDVKPVRLLEEEVDEQERHRRRDPIIFGTIRGSRDLYYVADWVYKDDDLTLETVEKAIGTIPTLKDERIADSQIKIGDLMHKITVDVEKAVAEARDTGHLIRLEETTARAMQLEAEAAVAGAMADRPPDREPEAGSENND